MAGQMTEELREIQHREPVWRDRSNFIIGARISPGTNDASREQLWVRQISNYQFELCCIPFFLYDIALGDIVETQPLAGRRYMLSRVVQPSGRYVFRIWFGESLYPRAEVTKGLDALDALVEWSSANLLAVDARDQPHAREIADYLQEHENSGHLVYETGRRG